MYPRSMFLAEIRKISQNFLSEKYHNFLSEKYLFTAMKYCSIIHRHVCIMRKSRVHPLSLTKTLPVCTLETSSQRQFSATSCFCIIFSICSNFLRLTLLLGITVITLRFWTYRSWQTVQTQIRLLLEEQSDQGLHCLLLHLPLFDEIPIGLASFLEF